MMKDWILKWVMANLDKLITDKIIDDAKKQFIDYLRAQAALTETEIDDAIVDVLARAICVK